MAQEAYDSAARDTMSRRGMLRSVGVAVGAVLSFLRGLAR